MEVIDFLSEDVHNNLISDHPKWPKKFTIQEKVDIVGKLSDYWESQGDYLKCKALNELKLKLTKNATL